MALVRAKVSNWKLNAPTSIVETIYFERACIYVYIECLLIISARENMYVLNVYILEEFKTRMLYMVSNKIFIAIRV